MYWKFDWKTVSSAITNPEEIEQIGREKTFKPFHSMNSWLFLKFSNRDKRLWMYDKKVLLSISSNYCCSCIVNYNLGLLGSQAFIWIDDYQIYGKLTALS